MARLAAAECEVFAAGDVAKVLRAADYLDDPLSGTWGAREERAFEQYLADQGVVAALVGWVTTQGEALDGGRLVRVCGDALGALHELARRVGFAVPAPEPSVPVPVPPEPIAPEPPPPAPRREAGFAPERSLWAWLFLAAVVGGTWWVVWRERRR